MKQHLLLALAMLTLVGCNNYDDFAISGTVVAHEACNNQFDNGLAISIDDSIGTIGADYRLVHGNDTDIYHNVVVVYNADQLVKAGTHITGRIYWDDRHSDAYCYYHYRNSTGPVPEACFTQLTVND